MTDYVFLAAAAFVAGMIDAVVGGGGLIQIPALFSAFPNASMGTLLGTNKLASVCGTSAAAVGFARKVKLQWSTAAPAAMAAFAFAFIGAFTVTQIPSEFMRKLLPFILVAVAIYTYRKKDFGSVHAPMHVGGKEKGIAILVGAGIGFYDGFFGPGTGSFLVFLFVRFFGFDFLGASAVAKIVNVACNIAAILWFGYSSELLWKLAAVMAVCNVLGSLLGIRLAIRHGSGFVRKIFLVVVSALILKSIYDAFLR
ncbi:MAG: TSUP family transporter [Burkholderiaceae bacterium]|uniref:sulfite exporter TauE/SafE family protein n=1 Tax=Herminiimonas sp. Marseille-P9896 TaxID=2742211 RepID=UPI001589025E|nr:MULTISPECIES: TSUP family transporter [Oxalobacteraceae]MBX9798869.1 TSUP family transporter [Burkholderiaceae bacterium]